MFAFAIIIIRFEMMCRQITGMSDFAFGSIQCGGQYHRDVAMRWQTVCFARNTAKATSISWWDRWQQRKVVGSWQTSGSASYSTIRHISLRWMNFWFILFFFTSPNASNKHQCLFQWFSTENARKKTSKIIMFSFLFPEITSLECDNKLKYSVWMALGHFSFQMCVFCLSCVFSQSFCLCAIQRVNYLQSEKLFKSIGRAQHCAVMGELCVFFAWYVN